MADIGHELTDELLKELEKRVKEEYEKALADAEKKLADWLKKFTREDEEKKKLLTEGQITQKEYKDWRFRHIMMGKEWQTMRDTLAEDFHNANQIALGIARGEMADVYALNMNYGTYDIEHGGEIDTGFQLYNHDAAELLMREENVQLMPGPSTRKAAEIAANKDLQWNQRHIQSAVLQGILQGESAYEVARRLQTVAQMDYNNAVRYARTMTTAAQNAGRYEAFRRADRLGVDLTIEWAATLDHRTRHDHRLMHGQRTTVDKPFHTPDGFTIMWPADCTSGVSTAPQGEIWNCRCTLLSWVKGFEPGTVTNSPKMGDMSFEEWLNAKPTPWLSSDIKQYEQYKAILKSKAPRSLFSFRQVKSDEAKWEELKTLYKRERLKLLTAKDFVNLPDIAIGRSIGAKRKSFDILDLATGKRYDLADGTFIRNVQAFAGKGTKTIFRDAAKYAKRYGGDVDNWQHVKGFGYIRTDDGDIEAEIHWSQCEGIGRFEFFVKEWLE